MKFQLLILLLLAVTVYAHRQSDVLGLRYDDDRKDDDDDDMDVPTDFETQVRYWVMGSKGVVTGWLQGLYGDNHMQVPTRCFSDEMERKLMYVIDWIFYGQFRNMLTFITDMAGVLDAFGECQIDSTINDIFDFCFTHEDCKFGNLLKNI